MMKSKLLNDLDSLILKFKTLHSQTKIGTWKADENKFTELRGEATNLLQKIYKGKSSQKVQDFNKATDGGRAVVTSREANGSRDTRNHNTMFKPSINAAINKLGDYRVELSTTALIKLRWTKKRWLAAIWSFITIVIITLIKEAPALIKAFKSK